MARIFGTIESLKSLKHELESKGVTRFNSVREVKKFSSNYNSEKLTILNDTSEKLEREYCETCINLEQRIEKKAEIIDIESKKIDTQIDGLQTKIDLLRNHKREHFYKNIFSSVKCYVLKHQLNNLEKNKLKQVNLPVKEISKHIENDKLFIKEYETQKQSLIEKRAKAEIQNLEHTRTVIDNSRNLISGAIGENLVVKEIKKLSDDYVLINDFNLNFYRPIFFKKYNQRINSIQIDHLLISKSGIFIIETKNWSKSSVNSLSLRSPIEQIERSNFALYIYISENITLNNHHWGEQQIPIRNLIVMINNKPKGKFKYVNIKLLKELNDYIKYFEPIFTDKQMNNIVDKLM